MHRIYPRNNKRRIKLVFEGIRRRNIGKQVKRYNRNGKPTIETLTHDQ
jgi:hypothetical protein